MAHPVVTYKKNKKRISSLNSLFESIKINIYFEWNLNFPYDKIIDTINIVLLL